MSNTKDTPMDYKQFEGHTPEPWQVRTEKEFIKPKTFQIINHDGLLIAYVNIGMFDVEQNSKLLAAAPDLLKENQSLKLELQKQKELKDELVNGLTRAKERIVYDNPNYEKYESTCCKSVILELESLIKKSSEI